MLSLEVTSDETSRLYRSGGTRFNRHRHEIIECHWIQTARRVTGRPNIFLYRHLKSGLYVLALWVVRPNCGRGPGLMMELEDMNGHPDKYTGVNYNTSRLSMAMVKARLQPINSMLNEYDKRLAEEAYKEMVDQEDTDLQRQDLAKHYDHRGPRWKDFSSRLASGELLYVGDQEGGNALATMRDTLAELK